ncbi:MAG: response regulator [Betaproteobacteria bacterium]|nr:response regulator [Betaproteobacteria bacterium]
MLKLYFDRYQLPARDLFAALADHSSAHIVAKDSQFRYLYLNHAAAQATGRPVEEILGQDDFFIFPPEVAKKIREAEVALLADGKAITIREAIQRNGRTGHLSTTKNAIYDSAGNAIGLLGIGHDITDLHVTGEAHREDADRERARHSQTAAIMEMMPAAVLIAHDRYGRTITGNKAAHELLQVPRGESLFKAPRRDGAPQKFNFYLDGRKLGVDELPPQRAAASGQVVKDLEMDLIFDNGKKRTIFGTAIPLLDGRQNPSGAVCALVDVSCYKRLQAQLQEQNKLKENFFGILGHELRNPLNALSNCVVLMTQTNDVETHVTMVQVMVRQVAQLKRLTNDLLDVNRIANGKLIIEKTHIDLGEVLAAAVETSRALIEKCGQNLVVRYLYSPIIVDGDFARLMQLVTNLLNNAAKFSPVGGEIRLSMERLGKFAVVSVRDSGIGIKHDMLGKIFDLYTQVDQSESGPQGGLGLGLALVKYIATRHGGSVHAFSAGRNAGAEFVVQLPIVDAMHAGRSPTIADR